jgi:hypothetical protein
MATHADTLLSLACEIADHPYPVWYEVAKNCRVRQARA